MTETIYFNGRKYQSITEMPSSERQLFEKFNRLITDEDQDGMPDLFQGKGFAGLKEAFNLAKELSGMGSLNADTAQKQLSIVIESDYGISVNGKRFRSVEEMPPDARRIYQGAITSVPGSALASSKQPERPTAQSARQTRPRSPAPPNSLETVDSTGRFIAVAVLAILLIGGLFLAWIAFF